MLDLKAIRAEPSIFKKTLARRGVPSTIIDDLLSADTQVRHHRTNLEAIRAQQNQASKDHKNNDKTALKELAKQRKSTEADLKTAEDLLHTILCKLPNLPTNETPDGQDESGNQIIHQWGQKPVFDFAPKEHWQLGEDLGIIDTARSAKISGSRFYFLHGQLAILQQALVFWAFQKIANQGFLPTIPPFMTRKKAIFGTGYLDREQNYCVNPGEDDLYLIGSSEVPMMSYFADEIIAESDLPIKMTAYSPCFRREAGSYGKDTKGIFRLHQFEKVEMIIYCLPEESPKMHELLLKIEEEVLQDLGIHYQVVNLCCGDLGSASTKTYDLEAWLPGQNSYREMTSTSNCTDFQTRRLNTRIRRKNGELVFAHGLNGTAVSSRPLIAIMENFQDKNGHITIPKVLQDLCGFSTITPRS